MNSKEGFKVLVRNPLVCRGVLAGTLLLTTAGCKRLESSPTSIAEATITGQEKKIEMLETAVIQEREKDPISRPITTATPWRLPTPERRIEQGFKHFRSSTYPYEIDYPESWVVMAGVMSIQGYRHDVFLGPVVKVNPAMQGVQTVVRIFRESVNPGVSLEEYQHQISRRLTQFISQARRGADGSLVSGSRTRIADYDAFLLTYQMPEGGAFFDPTLPANDEKKMVFIASGWGWQITFSSHPSITPQESSNFEKILASFRLLK